MFITQGRLTNATKVANMYKANEANTMRFLHSEEEKISVL